MNLYFLRHGPAGDRGDPRYPDDRLRPLDPDGRRKMKLVAAGMRTLGLEMEVWLSSPLLRARQTAEIAAGAFRARKKIAWLDELAPEGSPRKLVDRLRREHAGAGNILLVGHEPLLSATMGFLLAGQTNLSLVLKKGGLALLTTEALACGPGARLEWLLTPRQLLAIAAAKEKA